MKQLDHAHIDGVLDITLKIKRRAQVGIVLRELGLEDATVRNTPRGAVAKLRREAKLIDLTPVGGTITDKIMDSDFLDDAVKSFSSHVYRADGSGIVCFAQVTP